MRWNSCTGHPDDWLTLLDCVGLVVAVVLASKGVSMLSGGAFPASNAGVEQGVAVGYISMVLLIAWLIAADRAVVLASRSVSKALVVGRGWVAALWAGGDR